MTILVLLAGVAGAALRVALGGGWPAPLLGFALAAALGTWLRLRLVERWPHHGRGMLAANLLGTVLFAVFWKYAPLAVDTAPVLLAGFCGSLTTFSGFAAELLRRRLDSTAEAFAAATALATFALVVAVVGWEVEPPNPALPFGTLAANLLGCVLYGAVDARVTNEAWRRVWLAGFLGGLTTFSSLAFETHQLHFADQPLAALANVAATLLGGMALLAIGRAVAGKR